ncbi:hypothetical protein HPB52_004330 [Rhipicephalus sanguineus]|uniref:Uncharacterized protein n=1 Tax=Rhipicephalus sanguineus TaxID=34632 RepID=A0A9D4Q113_RHISA|nr:hypothetical protein HPB52_004330 [Rhipicephalus sanguineus]
MVVGSAPPPKSPKEYTALGATKLPPPPRQRGPQTAARERSAVYTAHEAEDDANDAASAVSWASVDETAAEESCHEDGQGVGKEDRPEARKGSQGERKPSLKGRTGPAASTAAHSPWWNKTADDDVPRGREAPQPASDQPVSGSVEQEKSRKAPGEGDAPKPTEPSISSREQPRPEPAPRSSIAGRELNMASNMAKQEGRQAEERRRRRLCWRPRNLHEHRRQTSLIPVSSLSTSAHRHLQNPRNILSSNRCRCRQASAEGGTAGAETLMPPTVELSSSRSGPRARARTRLTGGALNAASKRCDVTPRGACEAARRAVSTRRRRQNSVQASGRRPTTWTQTATSSDRWARLDRAYVTPSLQSAVVDCQAVDPPSYALGISDHRPVVLTLEVKDRSPCRHPWRVDNRLFSDETARATLRNRVAASTGDRSWDALKQVWRDICTDEGKKLKHRYSGLVRATLQRIRIVERGGPTSLLMKTYANDLKLRLARLRTLTSTTASSYQARHLPSSHPEVLNYVNSIRVGRMEDRGNLSKQDIARSPLTSLHGIAVVDSVCILGNSYRASGANSESWEEEVKELKQQNTRALEFNFPYYVRRYLLMGVFTDTYALKTTLRVLQLPEEHTARKLATYFLGVQSRLFLQTQPPEPKAINPTPFYRHVIGIYKRIAQLNLDNPLLEYLNTELSQELLVNSGCEAKNPRFPWLLLTPSWLPGSIQDVVWRFGWSVLPTADRMYKWHYVRSEQKGYCIAKRNAVGPYDSSGWRLVIVVCPAAVSPLEVRSSCSRILMARFVRKRSDAIERNGSVTASRDHASLHASGSTAVDHPYASGF